MSASFDKKDMLIYMPGKPDYTAEIYAQQIFDEDADVDVKDIEKAIQERKLLKGMCLTKTLIFIPEIVLTFFFVGSKMTQDRIKLQKYYWGYLRNKLSTEKFKKSLMTII